MTDTGIALSQYTQLLGAIGRAGLYNGI